MKSITWILAIIIIAVLAYVSAYPEAINSLLYVETRGMLDMDEYCVTVCEEDDIHRAFSAGHLASTLSMVKIHLFDVFKYLLAAFLYLLLPSRTYLADVAFGASLLTIFFLIRFNTFGMGSSFAGGS